MSLPSPAFSGTWGTLYWLSGNGRGYSHYALTRRAGKKYVSFCPSSSPMQPSILCASVWLSSPIDSFLKRNFFDSFFGIQRQKVDVRHYSHSSRLDSPTFANEPRSSSIPTVSSWERAIWQYLLGQSGFAPSIQGNLGLIVPCSRFAQYLHEQSPWAREEK